MVEIEDRKIPKELVSQVGFVDYNSSISEAKQALKNMPAIVVTKESEYYGIIDSRALSKSEKASMSEKAGKLAIKAPQISDSSSVEDLAYYFYKLRVKNLPYIQGGKITGVVERKTLLKMLLSLHALAETKVNDAMSSPVLSIDSDASLAQAVNAMATNRLGRLVVLDEGRFTGIITRRDINDGSSTDTERLPEFKSRRSKAADATVSGVMEKNVKTVENSDSLSDAARMMVEGGVSSLVVMRDSHPIGMLTATDILENVVAKRRIEEKKVFLAGFDEYTFQYEESVREELKSLMHHIELMHNLNTEYLALHIKRIKLKSYEMQARISFGGKGTIRADSEGPSFHDAFRELMKRLKTQTIKQKEEMLSDRKKRKDVKED